MIITPHVKTKKNKVCLEGGETSLGRTERGAWQQKNQNQYSVTTQERRSLTMKKTVKNILLAVASLMAFTFIIGCDRETVVEDEPSQVPSVTSEQSRGTGELLAWEKARHDYSYLEGKVEEANQYLTKNKLELQDLKQLHEIGNLIFGDYLSKIMMDFQKRSLAWLDDKLFINEYAKNDMYAFLIMDFHDDKRYSKEVFQSSPDIHIMTNHIGERNGWVFIPIRVYFPAPAEFADDPTFDENGGNDTRWRYYVLQLKRDEKSPYHWKVAYKEQVVSRGIDGEILRGAWFATLNPQDDFSAKMWKDVLSRKDYWEYYIGERDCPRTGSVLCPKKEPLSQLRSGLYDREAAARYAYYHALFYNTEYAKFSPNDCANFVSQCLYAGGIPKDNTWGTLDGRYPYYGTSTWLGANALYEYMKKHYGYIVPKEDLVAGYDGDRDCVLEWGDMLAMNRKGGVAIDDAVRKTHVMIISHSYHYTNQHYNGVPRYKVCGHTNNRLDVDIMSLPGGRDYVKNHIMGIHITY